MSESNNRVVLLINGNPVYESSISTVVSDSSPPPP